MRIANFIYAIASFALLYSLTFVQSELVGRKFVADEQLIALGAIAASYYIISAFDRAARFRILLLPIMIVVAADIIFSSLLFLGLSHLYTLYSSIRSLLAIFLFALAISTVEFTKRSLYQAAVSAISLTVAGLTAYLMLANLGFSNLALPALIVFLILAATSFATIFESEAAEILMKERAFIILLVIIVAFYILVVKPLLGERTGLANFVEWLIVATAFIKVSRDFKKRLRIDESEVIKLHKMREEFVKDTFASELDEAVKLFVENGRRTPLIVVLVRILSMSGLESGKIAELIAPLVAHQDKAVPRLSLPWERKFVESANRRKRAEIVEEIKKEIEKVAPERQI